MIYVGLLSHVMYKTLMTGPRHLREGNKSYSLLPRPLPSSQVSRVELRSRAIRETIARVPPDIVKVGLLT